MSRVEGVATQNDGKGWKSPAIQEGKEEIGSVPNHVAIIMDGNRRWAQGQGVPRIEGHRRGVNGNLEPIVRHAATLGISELTLWAFSTENWTRGRNQVEELFQVFRETFDGKMVERFIEEGVKIKAIGRISQLPEDIVDTLRRVEEETKYGKKIIVNFALNYGGRAEIVDAINALPLEKIGSVTEEMLTEHMYAPTMSPVDLIIRTGGEQRLSGFMLWESTYAEHYTSEKLWPDFEENDLDLAISSFASRERRFGGNSTPGKPRSS